MNQQKKKNKKKSNIYIALRNKDIMGTLVIIFKGISL